MDEIIRLLSELAERVQELLDPTIRAIRDWLNQNWDGIIERLKELWERREQFPDWLRERLARER